MFHYNLIVLLTFILEFRITNALDRKIILNIQIVELLNPLYMYVLF